MSYFGAMINTNGVIRKAFQRVSGYYMHKYVYLPIGHDLFTDIKLKIKLTPKTIFDVGANIGQTYNSFSVEFPGADIYCFEPINSTYKELEQHIGTLQNAHLYNIALGEANETIEIKYFENEDSVYNSLVVDSRNNSSAGSIQQVKVVTGDTFCQEHLVDEIDLLKIDTEGFEVQVLKGLSQKLGENKVKLVFAEVGFNPEQKQNTYFNDVNTFMYQHGFSLFGIYEMTNHSISKGITFANALYINNSIMAKGY